MTIARIATYDRQHGILDPELAANTSITIAGAGTVGSNAAIQLVRAGFKKFELYDFDVVENHNLPSQAFRLDDLGCSKVSALRIGMDQISDDLGITVKNQKVEPYATYGSDIFICAVDDMAVRKDIFENSVMGSSFQQLFIDVRMGGTEMQVFTVRPQNEKECEMYQSTLFSQEEASQAPCGTQTFAPIGALSGAVITQAVTNFLKDNNSIPYMMIFDFGMFDITKAGKRS